MSQHSTIKNTQFKTEIDTIGLSRIGFTLIRTLLETKKPAEIETAKELAEALHNLSDKSNEFLYELTIKKLTAFVDKYPELRGYIEEHVCLSS